MPTTMVSNFEAFCQRSPSPSYMTRTMRLCMLLFLMDVVVCVCACHWNYLWADILATSPHAGIIEGIPNAVSLDSLKKRDACYTTLGDFFARRWGSVSQQALEV